MALKVVYSRGVCYKMASFEQKYNDLNKRIMKILGIIEKEKDLEKRAEKEPDLKKKFSLIDERNRLRAARAADIEVKTGKPDWFTDKEKAKGLKKFYKDKF